MHNSQKAPLTRSLTLPNQYAKTSLEKLNPIPVNVPTPTWSQSGTGSISSRSSYSSSSSLEHGTQTPIYDAETLQELHMQTSPTQNDMMQRNVMQQNGRSSSDEYVPGQQNGNG